MKSIDQEQVEFARQQLEEEKAAQSQADRAEIKIKLIENGFLVKTGQAWFTFPTWHLASLHIETQIGKIERKRKIEAQKRF